jgi:hypothetical protein
MQDKSFPTGNSALLIYVFLILVDQVLNSIIHQIPNQLHLNFQKHYSYFSFIFLLSFYLSFFVLPVYPYIHINHVFTFLSVDLLICLSSFLSFYLTMFLFTFLSIAYSFFYFSFFLFIYIAFYTYTVQLSIFFTGLGNVCEYPALIITLVVILLCIFVQCLSNCRRKK